MKPHDWVVEEVDGGPAGVNEFWLCKSCGASGGATAGFVEDEDSSPELRKLKEIKREPQPFLAGPAMPLSDDCVVAEKQIRHHTDAVHYAKMGERNRLRKLLALRLAEVDKDCAEQEHDLDHSLYALLRTERHMLRILIDWLSAGAEGKPLL